MIVVYDSLTGNIERFIKKLKNFECIRITEDMRINKPFVLLTYTIGFGEVPKSVSKFLSNNDQYLKGVAGSGNMNWGAFYCGAAERISKYYNVPLIHKFELSGTMNDVDKFTQGVNCIV
nr:class Ib ribonucleoside-diphosphate reductase assembly flavoprotein NrdI [Paenibacillus sp. Marseille-Q4541]